MKKAWIKKNDRKDIIHEFLVAKFQYDFIHHQFQSTITRHNLVNILTFCAYKINILMFMMSFELWKNMNFKNGRKDIIHEFLVAKLQYDFSNINFKVPLWHAITSWIYLLSDIYKIHISMFVMSFDLWRKNESKRLIGRISLMNFW